MKISWDVVIIFAVAIIFFSIIVIFYHDVLPEEIYSMIYIFPILAASLMSFTLAKRYNKIPDFCIGHIFLGISMMGYVLAEIAWVILVGIDEEPYPSIVDVFYLIYAVFAILHPIAILRFFKINPKKLHYVLFVGIVGFSLFLYSWFSYGTQDQQSYFMGFIFVSLSSTLLGCSVLTILATRGRQIFRVWIIIGIAFLVNSLTDIPYYIMENFGDWDIGYWGNITWFISQMLLVYALIEHRNKYRVLQR